MIVIHQNPESFHIFFDYIFIKTFVFKANMRNFNRRFPTSVLTKKGLPKSFAIHSNDIFNLK